MFDVPLIVFGSSNQHDIFADVLDETPIDRPMHVSSHDIYLIDCSSLPVDPFMFVAIDNGSTLHTQIASMSLDFNH